MKRIASFLIGLLFVSSLFAQPGTPFASTLPTVPPGVGVPGIGLAWDTTNKLLVVTFTTTNAQGISSTLTTVSYNPHTLEGVGAGGMVLSAGGAAVIIQHNKPADPLQYTIGTSVFSGTGSVISVVALSCTIVTPTPTGQTACPALPF